MSFRPAIRGTAVGMPVEQELVEDQVSHIRGILGADAQAGQQLGPQLLNFRFREGRGADGFRKQFEQQRKVLDQGTPAEAGGMRPES